MKNLFCRFLVVILAFILSLFINTAFPPRSSSSTPSIDNSFDSGTTGAAYIYDGQPSCENAANCSTSRLIKLLKVIVRMSVDTVIDQLSNNIASKIIARLLLKRRPKKIDCKHARKCLTPAPIRNIIRWRGQGR